MFSKVLFFLFMEFFKGGTEGYRQKYNRRSRIPIFASMTVVNFTIQCRIGKDIVLKFCNYISVDLVSLLIILLNKITT